MPQAGPEVAIRRIVTTLRMALASQGLKGEGLKAIGVSCGSPIDPALGVIQAPPNLTSWKQVQICHILESEFQAPVFLENDANAGALAELRFGAGRGARDFVFLTMGTGLGAGIILNGRLHRGASYMAGEIGHVRLTRSGPRGHGKVGSVEGWASGGGMAQVAAMYIKAARARGESTLLNSEEANPITARDVSKAAKQGDAIANAIVRRVGERLGEAISILVDILNPERIAVGGLALRFGEDLLLPARTRVHREALRHAAEACQIVPAALGEQIGDVAALCIAMNGLAHREKPSAVPGLDAD